MKVRIRKFFRVIFAVLLIATACCCLTQRLPECLAGGDTAFAAAAFRLTDGKYRVEAQTEPQTEPSSAAAVSAAAQASGSSAESGTQDKSGYYDSFGDHSGEARYSVEEKTVGADGTAVENAYVKNRTGLEFDFDSILHTPLTFSTEKNSQTPQVLIYHTHTGEAYLDEDVDYFYESFYSRTQNESFNVVGVGNVLAETLEKRGIRTVHDKTVHDSTYNGSYDRSAETVYADMAENPDIKVVLDIHRDALGTEECKVKTVFEHDGQKAAQIMILSGCDVYGERGFDNWQNNLSFALKLQTTAESMYPGMTRPLSFDFFAYNEYICDGSLLIEVGTDANSVAEVQRTAEYLGEVLAAVLGG
ncbi:stage II sporulation protein P [Lachnoclostridium sp. MSJ-17]|nr:stage II sporulation protein P [Lachnoclostridium sp. MSJ-17]